VARILAQRIIYRNYHEANLSPWNTDHKAYMQRINPPAPEDAMVDYRGDRRTTPSGALAEINRLKQAGDLDAQRQQLLDDLEGYIKTNFSR
jgi:hypothetical protein